MRVYYFTGQKFALENIEKRRLKVSFSNEVNDLFELRPFNFGLRKYRVAWGRAINEHAREQGFVSFAKSWSVPTMWAHYAEQHSGLCYGFDIDPANLLKIDYVDELREFDPLILNDQTINAENVEYASSTKSSHWQYEEEYRHYVSLSSAEISARAKSELTFIGFSNRLVLKEVVIGARSQITSAEVRNVLPKNGRVEIRTARPSFQKFGMVEQKNKALQN